MQKAEEIASAFLNISQMHYHRVEQMSFQIYNKNYYAMKHFIGLNPDLSLYFNIYKHLSYNSMNVLLYLNMESNRKIRTPIKTNKLYKQTVFNIDWNLIDGSYSGRTRQRIIRELKANNIIQKLYFDTYVVSLDFISAFTLSQRRKYIDKLKVYDVNDPNHCAKVTSEEEDSEQQFHLQGKTVHGIHKGWDKLPKVIADNLPSDYFDPETGLELVSELS